MASILAVAEGTQYQSPDEQLAYSITTTNYGSTPTDVSVKAYDEHTGTDVTTTVFPTNSPSTDGDVITLSLLKSLTVGNSYRIDVKFTDSDSNIWEPYFIVKCIER
jgi:hypothetical protein